MGIDASVQTESGDRIRQLYDPKGYLSRALACSALEGTVCLRFIDPYGDALFNQIQLPFLLSELEVLRDGLTTGHLRKAAERQLDAARTAKWDPAVLEELAKDVTRIDAVPIQKHLNSVLELVRSAQGEVHIYVKFDGD